MTYDSRELQESAFNLLRSQFGPGDSQRFVSVPGRINLIGEHVDYHCLPVLPMALQRRVGIVFRPRSERRVRAVSACYGEREFPLEAAPTPGPTGDWANYLKAAMQVAASRWQLNAGIDAAIASDLPPAAGLSSSTALLVAFCLALLEANGVQPAIAELMELLPDGEQFVGTRGGGMDHAAVLACQSSRALLIHFDPLSFTAIPIPSDWSFLVAHSLTTAEKSGAVNAEYNARRTAGISGLKKLGLESYREAVARHSAEELAALGGGLNEAEARSFLHVTGEWLRLQECLEALRSEDIGLFGRLLTASHASLRDQLRVSNQALDRLVDTALAAGAEGARLTGAGFGGCAIVLTKMEDRERVRGELIRRYYSGQSGFDPQKHLFFAVPSAGALSV